LALSRGAATTFSAAATNDYNMAKVKLIVLEGCYDSVAGAAASSPLFLGSGRLQSLFVKITSKMTEFKKEGSSPIQLVDKFPEHVPVIFITSKADSVVPLKSVTCLVDALCKRW